MKTKKPRAKSHKLSWLPILAIKYPSGKTAFQVACMVQGSRIELLGAEEQVKMWPDKFGGPNARN